MANVDASVVVPARNERRCLEQTLESLSAQTFDGRLEIVVVASDSKTVRTAREHPVVDRVRVDDKRAGPGPARNMGVAASSGDVLLFTDADTVVPPTWVRRHCRHYVTPAVVGVGGPLRPLEDAFRHRACFRVLSDWWYRACWPLGFVQQPGCNCSIRRSAFETIGGFDGSLRFLEDTDISLRLRHTGTVVYDHTCPVETSARRQERIGYGRLLWTYLVGYLEYTLPNRSPSRNYFR
ncbi:glycosyltransferase [Natrinema halophilum]|uniref:Glycosyltransferase n=1 Tax=Natrinema halophilum TaxID=1699371 RepID=A0A7D5KC36_9EURY|nr:glycosyltransferase [Natrinema halophilum]QLG48316.1 glycosyltransferase [Natrinema halophilum]